MALSLSTWFISDTHFSHTNIIKYCERPFETIKEHDEQLIENWNSVVKKGDTVYHLGDFGFLPGASNIDYISKVAAKLSGKIILIKGNHDSHVDKISRFEKVKDYHVISHNKQKFILSHYPMRSWQFMNHGAIHLFGHCHANMPPLYKSFDIGIDYIAKYILRNLSKESYRPISMNEVVEYASTLEIQPWAI